MARRAFVALLLLSALTSGGWPHPLRAATPPLERWSDPATWGDHVPERGEAVTIPADKRVLLDVSPPRLGGITIEGALIFDEQDLSLSTEWILVDGLLQIGTAAQPHRAKAEIVLTDRTPNEDVAGMGDKVIGVRKGTLDIHGADREVVWTRLAATANKGDTRITLERPVDWEVGEEIAIASTDYDQYQMDWVSITAVSGRTVTIDPPLTATHWGVDQPYGDRVLNERAEVGLMTRNVLIRGDDASEEKGYGGHLMVMGGTARIEGAEFYSMGQAGALARYPIHFHMLGDRPDAYVRKSSIVHSFNRCVTVHGTNQVLIEENVAVDAKGHCFFLEDGAEMGNRLIGNLAMLTSAPDEDNRILPSDESPASFWITNPANEVVGNVAAGSDGTGFWYALPEHPTGPSASDSVWPRRMPLRAFRDNIAHSNGVRGLNVDDGPAADGSTETAPYEPHANPVPPGEDEDDSPTVTADFAGFTAYKNRDHGVWLRGVDHLLSGAILADNAVGATFASYESYLVDALIVGESANVGMPGEGEDAGSDGRALPQPWDPAFPIRGYQFYDGVVGARNVAFAGFFPNAKRQASGIGFLMDDEFALDPLNNMTGAVWLDKSNHVYIGPPNETADGSKTSVFRDIDGSVGGRAGQYIVVNAPFVLDPSCKALPTWNAAICPGPYVSLALDDVSDAAAGIGPVTVTRPDGMALSLIGVPGDEEDALRTEFVTVLPPNETYAIAPGKLPDRLRFTLSSASVGQSVTVTLPLAGRQPFVYGNYDWSADGALLPTESESAVDHGDGSVYYDDKTSGLLTIKLQVPAESDYAVIDVCFSEGCGVPAS